MAADFLSLNHVGEQTQLTVGGTAVSLVLPPLLNSDGSPQRDERGRALTLKPRHVLLWSNQQVRWRSDGGDPNPDMGAYFDPQPTLPGATSQLFKLSFINADTNFQGIIERMRLCKDVSVAGNATVEVAFFG